jgi:putative acetyltransferase
LDAYLRQQYPVAEFGVDLTHILPVDALMQPGVSFLAAWRDGVPVACGAMRRMTDASGDYGEVKRMYVHPDVRGLRIGQGILEGLEQLAREAGLGLMRLEGGTRQPEALRLYERCGYRRCERFGDYGPSPVSVFMEKPL